MATERQGLAYGPPKKIWKKNEHINVKIVRENYTLETKGLRDPLCTLWSLGVEARSGSPLWSVPLSLTLRALTYIIVSNLNASRQFQGHFQSGFAVKVPI